LPDEVVSLDAMLRAYAIDGARLQLHEDETGSITVGKAADLVVLDKDLRSIPAVDVNAARVLRTFVDGVEVYAREAARRVAPARFRRPTAKFVQPNRAVGRFG
jgi:predicted amidohydrolase YtcJ